MRRSVPTNWTAAIIVCRKCEKRLGGGFGANGRHRLSKLLKARTGGGKGRKAGIGVIESKCLKLCPKRAVTVVNGARPGEWLVVEAGTSIEEVAARLGLLPSRLREGSGEGLPRVRNAELAENDPPPTFPATGRGAVP